MSNSKIEQFHVLAQQLYDQYKVVEQTVDKICDKAETAAASDTLELIQHLLVRVKQTETQLKPIRDSLLASGETLPADTKKIVEDTVQVVTTLIPRIGALEKDAVESREKLAPVIHEGVRAAKMITAYSKQRT